MRRSAWFSAVALTGAALLAGCGQKPEASASGDRRSGMSAFGRAMEQRWRELSWIVQGAWRDVSEALLVSCKPGPSSIIFSDGHVRTAIFLNEGRIARIHRSWANPLEL